MRRQPRTIGVLAADLIQVFTTSLLPPCTYKDRKAICYHTICPCLDEPLHGPAPQLHGRRTVTWGTFRPFPCFRVASAGIRRHQVGFGWHRRAKATKILTNPLAIQMSHPIVPVYKRRGKCCVYLTAPPFPSALFLSLLQPGAVPCLFA